MLERLKISDRSRKSCMYDLAIAQS